MHETYMRLALELAKKGIGRVNPNPLVGAVLVKEGRIIGSGYHEVFGGAHAEVNAITSATESVEGATLYVTLEPCSHYGKTPPCSLAIISSHIKEVYIASQDPNPLVSGNGIAMLNRRGITTHVGLLDEENKTLNSFFFKSMTSNVPYVMIKTAMSLDGKIGTNTGESKWITSSASRAYVHELRHQYQSILVGINTVLKDDPSLTTRRDNQEGRNPIRVIVDSKGALPLTSQVVQTAKSIQTLLATTDQIPLDKLQALRNHHVEVLVLDSKDNRVDLHALMKVLRLKGIDSVLIEGGGTLNADALKMGIVDEIVAFVAPLIITGASALTPFEGIGIESLSDAVKLKLKGTLQLEEDLMITYTVVKEGD